MPLHPNQHAYHAGKSMDIALHQFLVRAEKAIGQHETALGVSRDKEWAFTYSTFDSVCDTLVGRGWTHHCPVD